MKILVDEMPEHPMECRYSEIAGNMKYQWWHCNYGDNIACENTKNCPFFMSFDNYKNRTAISCRE